MRILPTLHPTAITALFMLLAGPAAAEVYKCETGGRTLYADRPCDAAGKPAALPPLNTIQKNRGDDLVRGYDERRERELVARDSANASAVKSHAENAAREKAVRAAIIEHRAIKGMTVSELDSALGSPEQTAADGTRRYRRDNQRTTVTFSKGLVSGVSTTTERRQK